MITMANEVRITVKPKVVILMSTYNGGSFISEQLDSILSQTYQNIELLIRDDGSSDNTLEILDEYVKEHSNIHYYQGENVKSARSFLDLLLRAAECDYYAFADQDDVWLPNKIAAALELLNYSKADFYYSQTTPVNSELIKIPSNPLIPMTSLGPSLVYSSVTGCTVLISKKIRNLAVSYNPSQLMMHDSWLYKLTLSMGLTAVFDERSFILYRQHRHNVIGARKNIILKQIERVERLLNPHNERHCEVLELYKGYKDKMPEAQREVVGKLADYINYPLMGRLRIALSKNYHTGILSKDFLFFVAILLKRF